MIRLVVFLTFLSGFSSFAQDEKLHVCVLGDAGKNVIEKAAGSGIALHFHAIANARGDVVPDLLAAALKASTKCQIIHLSWNGPFDKKWSAVRSALDDATRGRQVVAPLAKGKPAKTVAGGSADVFLYGRTAEETAAFTARFQNEYSKRPPAVWRSFLAERKSRAAKGEKLGDVFK